MMSNKIIGFLKYYAFHDYDVTGIGSHFIIQVLRQNRLEMN